MIDLDGVSRETREALERYAALTLTWNRAINLVGRTTQKMFWRRHILDALQLAALDGLGAQWVDFGSGAGLPGLPLALGLRERAAGAHVILIESDRRKATFLREAVRVTGAPATVHHERIERVSPTADHVVTARALAPLDKLLGLAEPWLRLGGRAVFLKGRSAEFELTQARHCWTFHVKQTPSASDPDGVILDISEVRRKHVDE